MKYSIHNKNDFNLRNVEGIISCKERQVSTDVAKSYFKKRLKDNLVLNFKVKKITKKNKKILIDGFREEFDLIINCSWQKFQIFKKWNTIYEPCITFLYKQKKTINEDCLTIMGWSILHLYKWNRSFYNLYSVKNLD